MLWPKASPLDLDFELCAWAKLFNYFDQLWGAGGGKIKWAEQHNHKNGLKFQQ